MEFAGVVFVICAVMVTLSPKVDGWFFTRQTVPVCYNQYGLDCYSNEAPFNNTNDLLPESPGQQKVKFHLYTRTNPTTKQILDTSAGSISGSNFDGSKGTKFLIHGYLDSGKDAWVKNMRNEFLAGEDLNVIAVDWEEGASLVNYYQPVANTRVVGDFIGLLITEMIDCCGLSSADVHLIGHSLGAHVAGYAGTFVKGRKNVNVGRITGLDPAGPRFESFPEAVHLDPSDASLVEVIHTDGDDFWTTASFGARKRFGHLDFFPNGGGKQPGCPDSFWWYAMNAFSKNVFKKITCDHNRAIKLYLESINSSCQFRAYPCASREDYFAGLCTSCGSGCAYMGYQASSSQPNGQFFLETMAKSPFCISE